MILVSTQLYSLISYCINQFPNTDQLHKFPQDCHNFNYTTPHKMMIIAAATGSTLLGGVGFGAGMTLFTAATICYNNINDITDNKGIEETEAPLQKIEIIGASLGFEYSDPQN